MLGEAELQGKGCGLNAARDATTYEASVYVIGADGAVKEALYLARFARQVSIVCVEDELACIAEFRRKTAATPNIQVVPATRVGRCTARTAWKRSTSCRWRTAERAR
ncbi:MAG: hypothetical protein ACLSVD_09390 [Eggerthellaceae bacterium]